MSKNSRSRHEWMLDILDQILPAGNPAQIKWWGEYGNMVTDLLLEVWQRAHGRAFHAIPNDTRPEQYAFQALCRGLSLLLGSIEIQSEMLEETRRAFIESEPNALNPARLLGFIIWALDYDDSDEQDDPDGVRAMQEGLFLRLLLTPEEDREVRQLMGDLNDE